MKHAFIVHSNITFLIAKRIIEFEKIDLSNVFMITHRNYALLDNNYNEIQLDEFIPTNNFVKNYFKYRNLERNVIDKIKGEFKLYVPHLMDTRFLYLISHENCLKFSFIEEGSINYKFDDSLYSKNKVGLLKNIFYKIKYLPKGLSSYVSKYNWFTTSDEKLDKSYVFNEESLLPIKNKHIFEIENGDKTSGQFDCIIVFDAISINNIITFQEMMCLLEEIIIPHVVQQRYKNIAFKLHPEHWNKKGNKEAELIRKYFRGAELEITELEKNFDVETYLSKHICSIYTFISSLGLYAGLYNVPSYTVFNRVADYSEKIDPKAYNFLKKSINI